MNTIRVWRVTPGGLQAVDLFPAPQSLDQASELLPGGAYTTFCTYQRSMALRLDDHFTRLEETARLAGQTIVLERPQLRQALRQAVQLTPEEKDLRLRLSIDLVSQPGQVYLIADRLRTPPPQAYRQGVKLVTVPFQRDNPKAKLTGSIQRAEQVRGQLAAGVHEALMVGPGGQLLEGLSSNFFAVRSGQVWTAEEGVLSGITRSLVLDEILRAGIPLRLEAVRLSELPEIDEAFITSVSRGVLPVRQVDDRVLSSGTPGSLTGQIARLYQQRLEIELEPI